MLFDQSENSSTIPSRAKFRRGAFDADELMNTALRKTGRRGFSDLAFVEPLRRLLRSYEEEADLSVFGRYAVRFDMLRCLNNLLRLDMAEESDPAIACRPIEQPIFITGLPRSATTFLHTLLAQDTAHAVPRCWQLIYPYPSRTHFLGQDLRKVQVDLQFRLFQFLAPGLIDQHPLSADTPQECTDITAQVFQSLRFESTHCIPSYQRWLDLHGHHGAFRFHKRFLQHLDAQSPGRRWVLKSPDHVFALDAIRAVYPDAKIVFLHRDPLCAVASCVKLAESLHRPFTRHLDRAEIGRQVSSRLVESVENMIAATARRQDSDILHLHYRQVVSAPMEAVEILYRHCNLAISHEAEQRMRAWLAQPKPHHRLSYSLGEFGLNANQLRAKFSNYMRVFHISPEWSEPRIRAA